MCGTQAARNPGVAKMGAAIQKAQGVGSNFPGALGMISRRTAPRREAFLNRLMTGGTARPSGGAAPATLLGG